MFNLIKKWRQWFQWNNKEPLVIFENFLKNFHRYSRVNCFRTVFRESKLSWKRKCLTPFIFFFKGWAKNRKISISKRIVVMVTRLIKWWTKLQENRKQAQQLKQIFAVSNIAMPTWGKFHLEEGDKINWCKLENATPISRTKIVYMDQSSSKTIFYYLMCTIEFELSGFRSTISMK